MASCTYGRLSAPHVVMNVDHEHFEEAFDKIKKKYNTQEDTQVPAEGLKELCDAIHGIYKANDIGRLTTEMYVSNLEPAMKPADAFARMAHREIERVEIDDLEGRVTSALLTPYPPGIPLLIPGERFNRKIVDFLRFTREFNAAFPGFDTDVHGLVEEEGEAGAPRRYFVDCVRP